MTIQETRRAALVEAAAAILESEGRSALSTRAVAARAGVSTQGVYTAFGSREGLDDALRAELARQVDAHTEGAPSPVEGVERWWDWCLARPEAAALLYGGGATPAPRPAAIGRVRALSASQRAAIWASLRGALAVALDGGWSSASEGERAWRHVWEAVVRTG